MKICGVIWKLYTSIEVPETFVPCHFSIPFTHPVNPAQGRFTAAALFGWCTSRACTYQCIMRPLTRHVQSGSLQTREHWQASSFNTTSGADAERIQRMFNLLSSSVQPCLLGLGTLGLASKQRLQIADWKLALCACRKRRSLHGGSWLDSAAPLFAQKSW